MSDEEGRFLGFMEVGPEVNSFLQLEGACKGEEN
jgi:DUF438 domain-containing protein